MNSMSRGVAAAMAAVVLGVSGCGTVSNVSHVAHGISNLANGKLPKDLQDFDAKAKAAQQAVFKAQYDDKSSDGKTQSITIAQKPPKSKYQQGDEMIVDDGKNIVSCSPQGSNGAQQCLIIGPSTAASGGASLAAAGFTPAFSIGAVIAAFEVAAILPGVSIKHSSRDLAGQHLDCVSLSVTDKGKTNHGEYCETTDGILGYVDNGDGDVFQLSSMERSVSDSEFNLPAPAKTTDQLLQEATSTTVPETTTSTTEATTSTTSSADTTTTSTGTGSSDTTTTSG